MPTTAQLLHYFTYAYLAVWVFILIRNWRRMVRADREWMKRFRESIKEKPNGQCRCRDKQE